jgi:hypothetical protein
MFEAKHTQYFFTQRDFLQVQASTAWPETLRAAVCLTISARTSAGTVELFLQFLQEHKVAHSRPSLKQLQYFFRHLHELQWHTASVVSAIVQSG